MATQTITPSSANTYSFTVSGITTTPTAGATYLNNAITYTVVSALVISGSGTVFATGVGAPTASGTLTKVLGTGDATISFSLAIKKTLISQYTWASGDTFNINTGGELVIDIDTAVTGKTFGPTTVSVDSGTLRFINTGTKINVVSLTNTSAFFKVTASGLMAVEGQMLQIGTGSGADGQTIDFTTANATGLIQTNIDYPPFVLIETGSGTGVFEPYLNVGYQTTISCNTHTSTLIDNIADTSNLRVGMAVSGSGVAANTTISSIVLNTSVTVSAATSSTLTGTPIIFSDVGSSPTSELGTGSDLGRWFTYNSNKNLATFGQVAATAWGKVPSNGAKIMYPNIHITSAGYSSTLTSRSVFWFFSGGSCNIANCAISNTVYCNGANAWFQANNATITNLGVVANCGGFNNVLGTVNINGFYICTDRDTISATNALTLFPAVGNVSIQNIHAAIAGFNNICMIIELINPVLINNIYGYALRKAGTSSVAMQLLINAPANSCFTATNLYAIGGRFDFVNCTNTRYKNLYYSDQVNGLTGTFNHNMHVVSYCQNMIIETLRLTTNGAPNSSSNITTGNILSQNIVLNDTSYSGLNGGVAKNSGIVSIGQRSFVTNVVTSNLVSNNNPVGNAFNASSRVRIAGVTGDSVVNQTSGCIGAVMEWVTASTIQGPNQDYPDCGMFGTVWTAANKSTGALVIGGFNHITKNDPETVTVTSGVAGTDYVLTYGNPSGITWLSGMINNTDFTYFSKYPICGITDFSTAVISYNATPTNVTLSYKLWDFQPGVNEPSSWTTLSAANLQTSLGDTTNGFPNGAYSATRGFLMKLRVQASVGSVPPNQLNKITVTCTPPASWAPSSIGYVQLGVSGGVNGSSMSVFDGSNNLIDVQQIGASGTKLIEFPYNFDGNAANYTIKVRKAGYAEIVSTGSTYQQGKTVPISQVLNQSITDASVAGVSVNGATSTITLSSNVTLQQVYQHCQWWAEQMTDYTSAMDKNYAVPMTTTDGVNYASTYNLVINTGVTLSGTGALNLGAKTLTMSGTAQSSIDITYNSNASVWTRMKLTGLTTNSRVRLYDSTSSTQLYNAVVAATSLEYQSVWTANHTITYRISYCSGVTAKTFIESSATFTSTGFSVSISQTDDAVYVANAVDGSTVTGITITPSPARVKINLAGGTIPWKNIYAYQVYWLYGAVGIADEAAFITATDTANYILAGFDIRNDSTTPLTITGGWGKDSVTNTIAGCIDAAGSTGNIYAEPDHIIPYNANTATTLTLGQFIALK